MKSGKPLQRKTPLRTNKPLARRGVSVKTRRGHSPRPEKKPRPNSRVPAKKASAEELRTRKVVDQRSDGFCEKCGTPGATDKAHRVARGVGGPWSPANILDLCRACHSWHHKNPEAAYRGGWHLKAGASPEAEPVWFHHEGDIGLAYLHDDGTHTWAQEVEALRER